jgi:hypothetical protein
VCQKMIWSRKYKGMKAAKQAPELYIYTHAYYSLCIHLRLT